MATIDNRAGHRVSRIRKATLWVLGVIFTALVPYYMYGWLAGKVQLGYFRSHDVLFHKGQAEVEKGVTLKVDKVSVGNRDFDKLRIVKFIFANYGTRSLAKGAEFCFVANEPDIIPASAVVAVTARPVDDRQSIILTEQNFYANVGPGFIFQSAFPGEAKLEVQLVLDVGADSRLENVAIEMKQVASLEPSTLRKLGETTITFTFANFLIWLVLSAVVYGGVWLIINIVTGNYSSGARMVNWMAKALFGKGFIRESMPVGQRQIVNQDKTDEGSSPPGEPPALSE